MNGRRRIGSDWKKFSATAQRGPMAMKVNPRLNAPIPFKAPPEKKEEVVMLVTP
jgi:hypothetical protein